MSPRAVVTSYWAMVSMVVGSTHAAPIEVGPPPLPCPTIQCAVNRAAMRDVASSPGNTPNPDPVEIRVHAGTYPEIVIIPGDGSGAFNGLNDGWTIRNKPGDKVLVQGGFTVGTDRDHVIFEGLDINVTTSSSGFYFGTTARSCRIQNLIIYGNGGGAAIAGSSMYGHNFHDHVTIYGTAYGVSYGYASSAVVANCVTANTLNTGHFSSSASPYSHSDVYGCNPNSEGGQTDDGDNLNWPDGEDPLFASTDPAALAFLHPVTISPCAGSAATAGSRTNGELNMGALPTVPYGFGACCLMDGSTCTVTSSPACDNLGGVYCGDGTDCSICYCEDPPPCCMPDGTCTESRLEDDCLAAGGHWGGAGSTCASILCDQTLFEVGPGKEFATIQAAVDAAALLDDPGATNNNPRPDPVQIVVYEGVYEENVVIPSDPATAFNGANDGWTIRSAECFNVLVRGSISVGLDRDHVTFDGINLDMSTSLSSGFSFSQTARSCSIKNLIIFGNNGSGAAISGSSLYGSNTHDHVTIYGTAYGVSYGYASSVVVTASITAFCTNYGHCSGDGSAYYYSNVYGCNPNSCNGGDICVFCPISADPQFLSTDPANKNFLRLSSTISPCRGTGGTVGRCTGGEANMGAFPSGPAPPEIVGACCIDFTTCLETTLIGCGYSGGFWWLGAGTDCRNYPCCMCGKDPFADVDCDNDVDQDDFAAFQRCLTGEGGPILAGCEDFDRPEPGWPDGDGDVDNNDYQAFEACASGPTIPADKSCDD